MKKCLSLIILLATVTLSGMAQTIGEAFYIYRNDGQFNAFFRDEVQRIEYSYYDADSVRYEDIVTQVVITADSVYKIPLAAIDSVGFVQPETIYREGTRPLVGELFDYLIKTENMSLTFSSSIPSVLIPKVEDKIVATELSEKLPNGFVGKVRLVENDASGIIVHCDSLALEDAVSQFYSVIEIVSNNSASTRRPVETGRWPLDFNLPIINIPIDIRAVFTPEQRFGRGGKADFNIRITPTVSGRIVRIVDDQTRISYLNLHAVTDYETTTDIDIAGVVRTNFKFIRNHWVHRDIPGPWRIPVYVAFGPILEASGELAVSTTVNADFRHTADITFYPATIPYYYARMSPFSRALFQVTGVDQLVNAVNTVDNDFQNTHLDADWEYFAARGNIRAGIGCRIGVSIPNHDVAWIGCEGQGGVRCDAKIDVDFDDLENAERNTQIYDALKNNSSFTVMPYWGLEAVISGLRDQVQVRFGRDDYTFWGAKWKRDFLPIFSDTKVTLDGGTSANASVNITNDCLFPWTVGFSLFDENGNRIGEPQWNNQKFWTRNGFNLPLRTTFADLATDKKYKVYPTVSLFGHPILATPSAEIDTKFPVTLSDFKVTNKQHEKGAFTHEGVAYDYRFDVTVTATLDDDAEDIAEWGYVYLDPNGKEAFIPLNQFGHSYTDARWAYFRNGTPPFTCTLYGYVKYVGSEEPVYGEPHDYPLEYVGGETSCPDSNHPHWIDLGLPSGTQWRCCNEGASTPEAYGDYYTFGQVSSAPTDNQNVELLQYCKYEWTTQNGVTGGKFTGPNGGIIFLPAAGYRWYYGFKEGGSWGNYWSSTPNIRPGQLPESLPWALAFRSDTAYCVGLPTDAELPVRPVR